MDWPTAGDEKKYARFDNLSTEALEDLLRADIASLDDEDDDAIFYILDLLEQRERECPTGRLSDTSAAWAYFQSHYNTAEGQGRTLYPEESPTETEEKSISPATQPRTAKRGTFRRIAVIAAAVICLIAFAMPQALGYDNFIQMIGQWTDIIFHFDSSSPKSSTGEGVNLIAASGDYKSLQDSLDAYSISTPLAPKWIPDGFIAQEVLVTENPDFNLLAFHVLYENEAKASISVSLSHNSGSDSGYYEKDSTAVSQYVVSDITHYIFNNNGKVVAAWTNGDFECSISTDLSVADLEKVLNSIYER